MSYKQWDSQWKPDIVHAMCYSYSSWLKPAVVRRVSIDYITFNRSIDYSIHTLSLSIVWWTYHQYQPCDDMIAFCDRSNTKLHYTTTYKWKWRITIQIHNPGYQLCPRDTEIINGLKSRPVIFRSQLDNSVGSSGIHRPPLDSSRYQQYGRCLLTSCMHVCIYV